MRTKLCALRIIRTKFRALKYAFETVHTKLCALNHKIIRIKKCAQKYALKIVRTKLCALNHMRLNALNS